MDTGQALLPGNHSHHLQAGVVWIMQLLSYPFNREGPA